MSTLGLRPRVDILTSGHIILECRTDNHASFVGLCPKPFVSFAVLDAQ